MYEESKFLCLKFFKNCQEVRLMSILKKKEYRNTIVKLKVFLNYLWIICIFVRLRRWIRCHNTLHDLREDSVGVRSCIVARSSYAHGIPKTRITSRSTCESLVRFALVSNRLRSIKHLCRSIYLESFISFFPELITYRKPPILLGKLIIVPRNRLIIATLTFNGGLRLSPSEVCVKLCLLRLNDTMPSWRRNFLLQLHYLLKYY